MAYECQSCYSSFDESDIDKNSLGDPRCPECGGFDIVETDPDDMFSDDTLGDEGDDEDPEEDFKFEPEE